MTNRSQVVVEVFAGLDVSARQISVARRRDHEEQAVVASFTNNASGHKALLAYLLHGSEGVRVCLEASGNYSLDLALTLQAHRQVEVSLVNPRRARHFAESLGERSKTDPVDARVLCEYAARMPWVAWQPPTSLALRLRAITRAIEALGVMHTQEKIASMPWLAAKLCRPWLSRKCSVISVIWSIAWNGCGAKLSDLSHAIAS